MVDTLLHAGTGHPELGWTVVASLVTLGLGLILGMVSDRVRSLLGLEPDDEPVGE